MRFGSPRAERHRSGATDVGIRISRSEVDRNPRVRIFHEVAKGPQMTPEGASLFVTLAVGGRLYTTMSDSGAVPSGRSLQLLDVGEVAARLSVSPRFIRRLVNERRIPYCKVGKFVRFDAAEVADWVTKMRMEVLQ